jgi:hypothetical protein
MKNYEMMGITRKSRREIQRVTAIVMQYDYDTTYLPVMINLTAKDFRWNHNTLNE